MPLKHEKWLSYEIIGGKTIKKIPNRSTNNGDMDKKAKCPVSE